MMYPVIEQVKHSIDQKDVASFKKAYETLTNTCNSCHRSNDHGFNVIKTPDTPPVSDQEFKPMK